jgi:hypothetical protein
MSCSRLTEQSSQGNSINWFERQGSVCQSSTDGPTVKQEAPSSLSPLQCLLGARGSMSRWTAAKTTLPWRTSLDFDSSESFSIRVVTELFPHSLSGDLALVKWNFGAMSSTVTHSDTPGGCWCTIARLVLDVECQGGQSHGTVAGRVKSRLKNLLLGNNGYSALCKISEILSGNDTRLEYNEPVLNVNDLTSFKYAPVTSCDVERCFSCYITMLTSEWQSEIIYLWNIKKNVFMQCNSINDGKWMQPRIYVLG